MTSSHGNSHSEALEQIITEFYAKSLHIILEFRTPYMSSRNFRREQALASPSSSSSSSSSMRPMDKRFNLALRECPAARENLDLCQCHFEPMVVDVIMVQRPLDCGQVKCSPKRDLARNLSLKEQYPCCWNYEQDEFVCDAKSEKIIERWVVQYESRKIRDINSRRRRSSNNNLSAVYKKSMLLLRSLHVTVRLLPAYKAYRDINSSGQIRPFAITYRVSSFSEPFTCSEEAEMQRFGFAPVDTASGRLCISVLYCSSLSDVSSELSTPMSPQLIPDYVGSPLTDRLKGFPSLPVTGTIPLSIIFPILKATFLSHLHLHVQNHKLRFLIQLLVVFNRQPCHFIRLTSRSLPIFIPGSRPSKPHLQSESALASEPAAKLADFPAFSNKLNFTLRGTGSGSFKSGKTTGFNQPGTAVEKVFCFILGKMKLDNILGVKVSSSSSSRSFPDDLDDTDFAYAFDMEYDDATDPSSRPESIDKHVPLCEPHGPRGLFPIRKSQDAVVGALVHMLRKAPPLCRITRIQKCNQELDRSSEGHASVQRVSSSSVVSSRLISSKTTLDLWGYKTMKNLLIGKGSKSHK
ncbi:unnamed protein product [Malus baccata var. baccata]